MQLDFAQRHAHVNAKDVRMHSHRALELVYYIRGTGHTRIAGVNHAFRRGLFTITPSGMEHDQLDHGPVTSLCFGLIHSNLEPLVGAYRDPDGELLTVCEKILAELSERNVGWEDMVQGLLYQMAALVRRAATHKDAPPRQADLVDSALTIIRRQHGMMTVGELSAQLFVSHDYLRHLFQEHTGASPMRHIIQARIAKAQALLTDTDLPIAEVAEKAGFDSPFYFSRLFRQITSHTPSAFRKQHQR